MYMTMWLNFYSYCSETSKSKPAEEMSKRGKCQNLSNCVACNGLIKDSVNAQDQNVSTYTLLTV